MRTVQTFIDIYMTFSWVLAYTLVLIGTLKYKHPLIPPKTQLFIAPFEISVLISLIYHGTYSFHYVSICYTYWVLIQLVILSVAIKYGYLPKKHVPFFFVLFTLITAIMLYLVTFNGERLVFSYVNTFIGEVFWLLHFSKKEYPINNLVLIIFVVKFVADALSIFVYLGISIWISDLLCVLLPILDLMFIAVYFEKRSKLRLPGKRKSTHKG